MSKKDIIIDKLERMDAGKYRESYYHNGITYDYNCIDCHIYGIPYTQEINHSQGIGDTVTQSNYNTLYEIFRNSEALHIENEIVLDIHKLTGEEQGELLDILVGLENYYLIDDEELSEVENQLLEELIQESWFLDEFAEKFDDYFQTDEGNNLYWDYGIEEQEHLVRLFLSLNPEAVHYTCEVVIDFDRLFNFDAVDIKNLKQDEIFVECAGIIVSEAEKLEFAWYDQLFDLNQF